MNDEKFCKYQKYCCRKIYTDWLKKNSGQPPTRFELLLNNHITMNVYQNIISTKKIPRFKDGVLINECPHSPNICTDYSRIEYKKIKRKKKKRNDVSSKVKKRVAKKYKYQCYYCGRYANQIKSDGTKVRIVIDHFIPLAKGGDNAEENLVPACIQCNTAKSDDIWKQGCRLNYYKRENINFHQK